MRRAIGTTVLAAIVAASSMVVAQPARKVLVLRAEGRAADDATRGRIDVALLALAQQGGGDVTQGDITFGDAATMVGCAGDVATCKDQVLDTLAVDEVIAVSVGPVALGEVSVVVQRAGRAGPPVEARGPVSATEPAARLAEVVGALFGVTAPTSPAEPAPPPLALPFEEPAPVAATATAAPDLSGAPEGRRASRLPVIGMGAGAGMFVIGLLLWSKAASTQDDIYASPTRTREDLVRLAALESDADGYAGIGNVSVVVGVALAGVGGYFFWRQRRSATRSARVVPTVWGHGVGVAVTFGGAP